MAKSEEPHLPADGQRGAMPLEAARQVLRGAPLDSAGTDEVRLQTHVACEKIALCLTTSFI